MRIAIAGAAGFIGCHLAARYLADGWEVIGIDNLCTGDRRNVHWLGEHKDFSFVEQDITHPIEIDGPLDIVADLACPASPVDFDRLSVEILRVCSVGVSNMLALALTKKATFLHTSTSEVYGDPAVNPQAEDYWGHVNPIGARSVYDEGKRFAEATIMAWHRRYGLQVRLPRIFNTYGPRMRLDDGRVVTNFICQALKGQPLTVYGQGQQTRSFCHIDDQVDGQVLLAASDCNEPVNIGNPSEITVRQLAQEVIELTNSKSQIIEKPMPSDDPKVRCPDITKAKRVLGWSPRVDRKQGLMRTIEYCREALGM